MSNNRTTSSLPPRRRSWLAGFWFGLRMLEVRLRFVAILVAIGLVVGYWTTIQNYWDRWTRPHTGMVGNTVSDQEFYCPMDPSIVRPVDPSGKVPNCPICGMPLSLRIKGEPMILPPGVVSRVTLGPERVRMAGVKTTEIALRPMQRSIRTVGNVTYNQENQSQIVTRIGGFLEKLFVDKTFVQVQQGDPLAEIYSPELYTAVQELRIAGDVNSDSLVRMAREKIQLLGIAEQEIDSLLRDGSDRHRIVIRSPADGFVVEKNVQQGASVAAGQQLFAIADLSSVWIEAAVYERDLSLLRVGEAVEVTVDAWPGQEFVGTIDLIYPEVDEMTRTNRVRFEIANPNLLLRPGMYATVRFASAIQESEPFRTMLANATESSADPEAAMALQGLCPVTGARLGSMGAPIPVTAAGRTVYLCCEGCRNAIEERPDYFVSRITTVTHDEVLAIPQSAVIDTGEMKIAYVDRGEGIFEGVEIDTGPEVDGFYPVISGLLPGERVAAAGAFLIDAETRLNPAASAAYFGSTGGPSAANVSTAPNGQPTDSQNKSADEPSQPNASPDRFTGEERAHIAQLSPELRALAEKQVLCPVTEMPLGSMGVPPAISIDGQQVLLCCAGCEGAARSEPAATLEKVRRWIQQNEATSSRRP